MSTYLIWAKSNFTAVLAAPFSDLCLLCHVSFQSIGMVSDVEIQLQMGVWESNVKNYNLTPEDKCMGLFCKHLQHLAQRMIGNKGSSQEEGKCRLNIRMCLNSEPECALLQSDLEKRAVGLDVSAEGFPPGAHIQCSTTGFLPPVQRTFLCQLLNICIYLASGNNVHL